MSDVRIGGAPYRTPSTRKKLPAPFSRARIDLDGGRRAKRSWKDTPVTDIKKGDTVANFGLVSEVIEFIQIEDAGQQHPWRIRLHNIMGDYQDFPGEQRLYVFSVDE